MPKKGKVKWEKDVKFKNLSEKEIYYLTKRPEMFIKHNFWVYRRIKLVSGPLFVLSLCFIYFLNTNYQKNSIENIKIYKHAPRANLTCITFSMAYVRYHMWEVPQKIGKIEPWETLKKITF